MPRREIVVRLDGELASVPVGLESLVEPLLSTPATHFARAPGGAVVGRRGDVCAGRAVGGEYLFPVKLVWGVGAALERVGYGVRVEPGGPERLPEPAARPPGAGGDALDRLLATPAGRAGRLLRFGAGLDPADAAGRLVAAYPGRRVVVAARNRGHAAGLVAHLRRTAGRPVLTGREFAARPRGGPKVVVVSLAHLDLVQAHDVDVVVVPDARPLLGAPPALSSPAAPYRDYRVARTWWVPAFGLLPAGMRLSPLERLSLGVLFGPEARVGGAATAGVAVRAEVDPAPAPADLPDPAREPAAYRRAAVWRNAPRTAWVAGLARAAAGLDPTARVLVLAEAAHAPAVAAELTWPVVAPAWVGSVPGRAVATEAWASAQRPLPADVLIDARGLGPVDLAGFPPRQAGSVTLVDAGVAGPLGAKLQGRRLDAYGDRGWAIATT